ncbi:MAG TPA: tryptophan--tRNA ligase, partial [Thermomicrobiales bacterium]|nr:tryptophan--tRNA ligase [Thermomicrobiales bacterium]
PSKKMSKSSPIQNSYIALNDPADVIRRKIRRAVTDSGSEVVADPDKPALANLIGIYAVLTDSTPEEVQAAFAGKGYGDFKAALGDVVVSAVEPIQERLAEYEADPDRVETILREGTEKARAYANVTLARVRDRIGIGGYRE